MHRVMPRPVKVLGYTTQVLKNNWKLYVENVKAPYHASIPHLFFTTFRINRLSQKGGVIVSPSGGHHVSYSKIDNMAPTAITTPPPCAPTARPSASRTPSNRRGATTSRSSWSVSAPRSTRP